MGTSIPNRRERERVCSNCPARGGCSAYYSPQNPHKVSLVYRALNLAYPYCKYYDHTKRAKIPLNKIRL